MLESAVRLTDSWLSRRPDLLLDPPHIWDDVVTNRSLTGSLSCLSPSLHNFTWILTYWLTD